MEKQEQMMQLQIMQQEANQLDEQLKIVDKHMSDLTELELGLNELKKSKEIKAGLGKGIYVPAEIKEDYLLVEVGNKNFVKKSIPETKEIIKNQLEKLSSVKQEIMNRVESLQEEMTQLFSLFNVGE